MASSNKSSILSSSNRKLADNKADIYATIQVINILRQKKQLHLAEAKAKDHLENKAFSIEILAMLADLLVEQQSAQRALDCIQHYKSDVNKEPKCKELLAAQAKALLAINESSASLELIQTTTSTFPNWADGWNNHGCTLLNLGRDAEAVGKFNQALKLEPTHFKAALALATIHKKSGRLSKAIETLQNCFNESNNPSLLESLINLLNRNKQHELALDYAKKLIKANQSPSIEQHMLLAQCYFANGDLLAYIQALQDLPKQQLWKGVSVQSIVEGVIAESGLEHKVDSQLDALLEAYPSDANANLIRAREKLRQFNFCDGWKHYAHRLKLPNPQLHFNEIPSWDGSDLQDKNVLVIGEQGIGDVGYFARFLPPLLRRNNKVSMLCESRMRDFLQHCFPDIYFFSNPKQISLLPKPMTRIALGSLPLLYGMHIETIHDLGQQGPLFARPSDHKVWAERLQADAQGWPVVGLSLHGGRNGDEYQQRKRSLPTKETLQLLAGRDLAFLDLQHPNHGEDFSAVAEELNLKILQYPNLTDDVSQLLAAMSCLNGLITAQQTNAHLAGAIGLRSIVALPVVSHFVYGLGPTTPWYPSLKLVRATKFGEWDSCLNAIPLELEQWQGR